MTRKLAITVLSAALFAAVLAVAQTARHSSRMGKQPDGSYIVSTGRRIEPGAIAFGGRPIDLALHPSGNFIAVLNQQSVFLADKTGVIPGSTAQLADGAGYRGTSWSPDGTRLWVSVSEGYLQELRLEGRTLIPTRRIAAKPPGGTDNPRPGGMAITRDGKRLYVAACDRNAVEELDADSGGWLREFPVANLPFEVKLTPDERTLVVSNWGGRLAHDDDDQMQSGNTRIVVDSRGSASTGTVSIIDLASGKADAVSVGLHPTGIAISGDNAYIADAASDTISELSISAKQLKRTIPIRWGGLRLFGSMPCALAISGDTLYACDGGDDAVCEISLRSGGVEGFRPAGYFPTAIALSADGASAYVLNTKGNGSVRQTSLGKIGNVHEFQGTVSVLDLGADLRASTAKVVADNRWDAEASSARRPALAVYHGSIKHVLYIIKENRTYDEVFGDMPQGNGDAAICDLGRAITPNAHALAEQFTLFDNSYVSGTNSADGHAWSTQALADDYMEHFYAGYRTYPDDGDCAMAISPAGGLWDAALQAGKTLRIYGEFCDDELAVFTPQVKSWMDLWKDRQAGTHHYEVRVASRLPQLNRYIHPRYVYWPLLQSDQRRADLFIAEYNKFSRESRVPDLMIMSLPSDHTEGLDPNYPRPASMVADNDLALGRIVEAVSRSPQWKETCIFVIEDDAQSGPDHVDGHRTVYLALSPYTRRRFVDSSLNTTLSMLRSIEMMLGIRPMNRFDALTAPLTACFTDAPDLTPYRAVPAQTALAVMNPPLASLRPQERIWAKRSLALDWSGLDRPDPSKLNAILAHALRRPLTRSASLR